MRFQGQGMGGSQDVLSYVLDASTRRTRAARWRCRLAFISSHASAVSDSGPPRHRAGDLQPGSLVALLDAGLSLVESIETLPRRKPAGGRRTLDQVLLRLREARPGRRAGRAPLSFPTLYVATVRAAERTGALREASPAMSLTSSSRRAAQEPINASIYPAVLCVADCWCAFLMGYVVHASAPFMRTWGASCPSPRGC